MIISMKLSSVQNVWIKSVVVVMDLTRQASFRSGLISRIFQNQLRGAAWWHLYPLPFTIMHFMYVCVCVCARARVCVCVLHSSLTCTSV